VPRIHWVGLGTGTPKDRDEVNKRELCECDGCLLDSGWFICSWIKKKAKTEGKKCHAKTMWSQ
jgi:hypothetical protein